MAPWLRSPTLEGVAEDAEKAVEEDYAREAHVDKEEQEEVPFARVEDAGQKIKTITVVEG